MIERLALKEQGSEINLWLKEYLLRIHNQLLEPHFHYSFLGPLSIFLWEKQLLKHWKAAKLWHMMLHVIARNIIRKCS
ncbi:hypothetical protein A7K93_03025 [Candidatus Methylacidiphilum fumarolicum]|uniref:Uncharacterized protein n=2 Tax=Candidatus Methylacidiphilum fumarolicum TaxID=591154 RepID=I0JYV6_METFB|nr:hypothetical protein [Candidatus Methylacidiphilum fumarolicum]CCG92425.1 hypothetical protein MFUM_690073 [Methylacidiphilum fumariolicum SolV]TFE69744.1 hypothetical protein A7K73_00515 [Candidatus Methylacidiphilum fumarolicum]TFE74899.1 hypothetical protein A7K93_03025 [Candidatus Methylacidiphilum fumarolicum]TFE75545.1 hypothetical protein A7K72_01815 [Candidatus Methylacidiphilum fumarolicum]